MKNIVVSMQNTLLSEAIAHALTETREFRVEQILPDGRATRSPCAPPCRRISADGGQPLSAYTMLESRLSLIDRLGEIPGAVFALL